jgi:hypothetical protein
MTRSHERLGACPAAPAAARGIGRRRWAPAAALSAAAVALGGFGVALAQDAKAPDPAPPVARVAPAPPRLSPAQMLAQVTAFLPEMERGAATVHRQLEEAQAARDVVKIFCLRDKEGQIAVALTTARDRAEALRIAAAHNDRAQAAHEFTVIWVLRDQVAAMVSEANQCIGVEEGFIGDSRVEVEIDPDIPDDPTDLADDPLISAPPLISSPIQ